MWEIRNVAVSLSKLHILLSQYRAFYITQSSPYPPIDMSQDFQTPPSPPTFVLCITLRLEDPGKHELGFLDLKPHTLDQGNKKGRKETKENKKLHQNKNINTYIFNFIRLFLNWFCKHAQSRTTNILNTKYFPHK